jgi:transcriptional regulator PpsR
VPQSTSPSVADPATFDHAAAVTALTGFADILLVIDHGGHVLHVSFGHETTLFAELAALSGRNWMHILSRESQPKAELLLREATAQGLGRGREINLVAARDGALIPIRFNAMQQGPNGDVLLVGRDLRPLAELQRQLVRSQHAVDGDGQRLRAAETRFKVLFQTSADALLIADATTRRVTEANAAALTVFDLTANRLVGRTLTSLFDAPDMAALTALLARAANGGTSGSTQLHAAMGQALFAASATFFRQDDGTAILLRLAPASGSPVVGPGEAMHLATLIEMLPEAFVVTDGKGHVITANRTFLDMAELPTLAAAIGQPLERWLGRQGMDFSLMFGALHEAGRLRGVSSVVRGLYGALEPVEVTGVRLHEGTSTRTGFVLRSLSQPVATQAAAPVLARSADQMRRLVGSVPLKDIVREAADLIERLCVEAALELSADNRAAAADMLGLSRQSLYAKLHRYGLGDLGGDTSDTRNNT